MVPTEADKTIRNPFKRKFHRDAFAEMVYNWRIKASVLFHKDGSRCMGNSFASFFWKGYDGTRIAAGFNDRASKEIVGYIYYRAGQECAKAALKESGVEGVML